MRATWTTRLSSSQSTRERSLARGKFVPPPTSVSWFVKAKNAAAKPAVDAEFLTRGPEPVRRLRRWHPQVLAQKGDVGRGVLGAGHGGAMTRFKDIPTIVSDFIERAEGRGPVDRSGILDPQHAVLHVDGADSLLAEELDARDGLVAVSVRRHVMD